MLTSYLKAARSTFKGSCSAGTSEVVLLTKQRIEMTGRKLKVALHFSDTSLEVFLQAALVWKEVLFLECGRKTSVRQSKQVWMEVTEDLVMQWRRSHSLAKGSIILYVLERRFNCGLVRMQQHQLIVKI
ncbi:hypothetical protein scyTo_0023722 [Scyliorhinus torazame]|uniref:Uncharacterized protein n=1 Tax=Scyliorhinus torazame TaxID=75743 RepID=A0A401QCK9_SCYTO|nr:hypothetical protein [Scyliorhinus torazame]